MDLNILNAFKSIIIIIFIDIQNVPLWLVGAFNFFFL